MKKITAESNQTTNFFNLKKSPKELDDARYLIGEQNGNLPVLIHPFFYQYFFGLASLSADEAVSTLLDGNPNDMLDIRKKARNHRKKIIKNVTEINAKEYFLRLRNFAKHPKTKILLLGEPENYLENSISLLRAFGFNGNILFYKTIVNEPVPHASEGTWESLADTIIALNIIKIIAGGQISKHGSLPTNPDLPVGCVPGFIRNIESRIPNDKKIEFIISPISYPHWWTENKNHPYFRSRIK